jgi:polyisoprenoid-binding protein YceI
MRFLTIVLVLGSLAGAAVPRVFGSPAAPPAVQRFAIVPGESTVTYRVNETLFNEGNRLATAVGITSTVRGEVFVDRTRPASSRIGTITVDISRFRSDSDRRDNAIRRRWLESAQYPIAEFAATAVRGLPDKYEDGRDVPVGIAGTLTVRGITQPVTWTATIRIEGDTLTVTGRTTVRMTDFGFDPPSIAFLRTENDVRLEFRLVAR